MLIDSHAHLDDEVFDEDREELINSFKEAGIDAVIVPAANMESSRKIADIIKGYDFLYGAVGVHPHDTKDMKEEDLEEIERLSKEERIVAIGEIGLDYYYENTEREIQKKWFREQIKLAKKLNLPIIVHEREAAQDVYDIISDENDDSLRGVIHCYSGSIEMAREYMKLGFYISFAGPVTFKNAVKPKEVSKEIPLDRILVETDSPYLTPVPYRGKRNNPTYVRYVAEQIADLKGISLEELAEAAKANTIELFGLK